MARQQWGIRPQVPQSDKTAFAQAVLDLLEEQGDIASEATWQKMSQIIAQYWLVFQTDQSPLSTWNMFSTCTANVLKIRAFAKAEKGSGSADALEQFRSFMGEVLGDETKELPDRP